MTFKLGLTGSIGMGKSTTAQFFRDEGCDVWDADAAVHRLYAPGGAAVEPMRDTLPEAIENGAVSRAKLKEILQEKPEALRQIEAIVHPLVAQDRMVFIECSKADIIVFDIPLLFETGGDVGMDAVACVSVSEDIQRSRVMERGTMSQAQFEHILSKQMPDADKRSRADFLILTDTLEHARSQVQSIVSEIRSKKANA